MEEGSSVNLSALSMSLHAGTHADSPLHVSDDGAATDALPLDAYMGTAEVVAVDGDAVRPADVDAVTAPRVLFKTVASDVASTTWSDDFPPILPETVAAMAARDVVLTGTDAPSVDPVDSKDLRAHHALFQAGIVNLENLNLHGVSPGRYLLVAFPLHVPGADAAPVRAVLIDDAPNP